MTNVRVMGATSALPAFLSLFRRTRDEGAIIFKLGGEQNLLHFGLSKHLIYVWMTTRCEQQMFDKTGRLIANCITRFRLKFCTIAYCNFVFMWKERNRHDFQDRGISISLWFHDVCKKKKWRKVLGLLMRHNEIARGNETCIIEFCWNCTFICYLSSLSFSLVSLIFRTCFQKTISWTTRIAFHPVRSLCVSFFIFLFAYLPLFKISSVLSLPQS